jgi:hypothetical protein
MELQNPSEQNPNAHLRIHRRRKALLLLSPKDNGVIMPATLTPVRLNTCQYPISGPLRHHIDRQTKQQGPMWLLARFLLMPCS